jgi:putative oxidoreductase
MQTSSLSVNLVLAAVRVFLGAMIFAHGFNKFFRGGRIGGTASWFDSIGMRPGRLNAILAAVAEMGVGILLVAGLLTPLAAAGLIALMTVAIVTVHWKNGFFVFNKGQGIEYCLCVVVMCLVPATFGAGRASLDYLLRHEPGFGWASHPSHGLLLAVVVGFGAALLQMAALYRPPREGETA